MVSEIAKKTERSSSATSLIGYEKAKKTKSSTSTKTCCCSDSFKDIDTLQATNASELKKDAWWKSEVDSWSLQTLSVNSQARKKSSTKP